MGRASRDTTRSTAISHLHRFPERRSGIGLGSHRFRPSFSSRLLPPRGKDTGDHKKRTPLRCLRATDATKYNLATQAFQVNDDASYARAVLTAHHYDDSCSRRFALLRPRSWSPSARRFYQWIILYFVSLQLATRTVQLLLLYCTVLYVHFVYFSLIRILVGVPSWSWSWSRK